MQTAATPKTYNGPLGRALARKAAEILPPATETLLHTMRVNILELVADRDLFSEVEHLRTNDSVYQCQSMAKLQTWFRNVYRVRQQRQMSLRLAFADGTYCHLPVQA